MNADSEIVLIVDDEEPVRRTFQEWFIGSDLNCRVLTASDAESALVQANEQRIDLAILDWNLGAGNDGLQLLEDLTLFNPDVVAILVTGFAHQATPLQAMRMGVRDYLDKNQDLDRTTFLRAVRRQLERIRPARRERQLHQQLVGFRATIEKILPLVQTAGALADPLPLPAAIAHLFAFLLRATGASDGVLLARSYEPDRHPVEISHVYDHAGQPLSVAATDLVPFAQSLAGSVVSMQRPCLVLNPEQNAGVPLQPFERGRHSLLAAPLSLSSGLQVVLELFDKEGGFNESDRQLAAAAADFGGELFRQALAGRQTHRVLFDAVAAALGASDEMAASLRQGLAGGPEEPPPDAVLDRLRSGLQPTNDTSLSGPDTVRLAEAVRELAIRHGPAAVRHCIQIIESLRTLLDDLS